MALQDLFPVWEWCPLSVCHASVRVTLVIAIEVLQKIAYGLSVKNPSDTEMDLLHPFKRAPSQVHKLVWVTSSLKEFSSITSLKWVTAHLFLG